MAIFTNLAEVSATMHGMAESSNLKSTVVGNLYDIIVRDSSDKAINCDNGVGIKVGEYTGEGLQTRYGTVAAAGDKIAFTCDVATVKDAFTKEGEAPYHWYCPAGKPIKTYEVVEDDIICVAKYQFTSGTPTVGHYVTVDGNGGWVDTATEPDASYGFVGKVHSIANNDYYPMIRIRCIKNAQV